MMGILSCDPEPICHQDRQAMGNSNKRLIIDITDWNYFLATGAPISGIQRVTLNLLRSLCRLDLNVAIIRYDVNSQVHRFVSSSFLDNDFSKPRTRSRRDMALSKSTYGYSGLKTIYGSLRSMAWMYFSSDHAHGPDYFETTYVPLDGDIIYIAGAGWDCAATMKAISGFKRTAKVHVAVEIFDMIQLMPLIYKNKKVTRQFESWFAATANVANLFVCLSKHTELDFKSFSQKFLIPADTPSIVVTPAHEFNEVSNFELPSEARQKYALCVSKVFGHKNGRRVIEAWKNLESTHILPCRLLIAGNNSAEDVRKVYGDVPSLRVIERPSDSHLAYLYANAEFTVFPSLYEGWGMPVGESLWLGTPCLASNCAAIPEVGREMCDYFDPNLPGQLESLMMRAMLDPEFCKMRAASIDRKNLKSNDQYALQLYQTLVDYW
jgi:glycosyltransferase involved in cell wall biosynthesis